MAGNYSTRDALESDLPQIVAIYNSTIASRTVTADTDPVTVEQRWEWFWRHDPACRPLWVVDAGGSVAAWLSFETFYGRPAYAHTAEVSLYVRESWRRRGIGRFLLGQAIAHGPDLGLRVLLGFIFSHNLPSLQLFEGLGFTCWGELPRVAQLDGTERSLTIVGRRIGEL